MWCLAGHLRSPRRTLGALWYPAAAEVEDAVVAHSSTRDLLMDHAVTRVPGASADEAEAVAELRDHLAAGGTIGRLGLIFKARWRAALAAWRVDGEAPTRPEHFAAIAAYRDQYGIKIRE